MTIKTHQWCALLDHVVAHPSIRPACKAVGIDPSSFWCALKQSAAQSNERLRFYWSGEFDWLHSHWQSARRRNVVLLEAHLREVLQSGHEQVVIYNGRIQYEEDPRFAGWTDQELLDLGWSLSDRFMRDELGRAKPLTIKTVPPAHLLIRGAQSYLPNLWADRREVKSDINVAGGVLVLSGKAKEPEQPRVIEQEHHVSPLALPPPLDDADATTDRDDDSPLVRDLRARLRQGVKHAAPSAAVMVGKPEDEPREPPRPAPVPIPFPQARRLDGHEGLGRGDPAPGGFRTV